MNVVCILAGGSGNRFGSPVPKQYHRINGRPVIEYVISAAIKSMADDVIVVADRENILGLEDKYGVTCVEGGNTRNESIANALKFISARGNCNKIIIAEAVCPMLTGGLLDTYFDFLDEYEAVFTVSEITSSLARYDGKYADRNDFFLVESPDAYRFNILNENFSASCGYSTPLYCLPQGTKIKYYSGFRDYIKIIHPHDLATAEALMRERSRHVIFEAHPDDTALELFARLRKTNRDGVKLWEKEIDGDVRFLFARWDIRTFTANHNSYAGLALECSSGIYGETVIKIYPRFYESRYIREKFMLNTLKDYSQVEAYDFDDDRRAIITARVIPGDYADINSDTENFRRLFAGLLKNRAQFPAIPPEIRSVIECARDEYREAAKHHFYPKMTAYLLECAGKIYSEYFAGQEKFIIHGNIHTRNALKSDGGIVLINPYGYCDAFEFEYMPLITHELAMRTTPDEYLNAYSRLLLFFSDFADIRMLNAAAFVFLVRQMIPSIYEANDNFRRAASYFDVIKALFLDENNNFTPEKSI